VIVIEFIKAGGFLMYPLLLCSLIASAIIVERFWSLQRKKVAPKGLTTQAWNWVKSGKLDARQIETLRANSPLGRILAAGLVNHRHSREVMKESLEEVGGQVVHELGRYLNALGTIAAISPLLGLLGTVFGMIEVFATITTQGVGNASALAGGISQALITTATGLSIAIPALLFYRYFRGRVESLVVTMEQEALRLVEVIHHAREVSDLERSA
jgi:biopolymer transport protein ExbB